MVATGTTALVVQHQVDAIKAAYHGTIDARTLPASYPSLSHHMVSTLWHSRSRVLLRKV